MLILMILELISIAKVRDDKGEEDIGDCKTFLVFFNQTRLRHQP